MAVYQLDDRLWFPNPYHGKEDGWIAVGGDLSVPRLILAYSHGFFPWFSFKWYNEPHWYCPLERYVIFPDEIHISHSMKQLIRQQRYMVTLNLNFEGVIRACSTTNNRHEEDGAWLGEDMIKAYLEMHKRGYAASIEVWETTNGEDGHPQRKLVGGLYGITLRKAFFGESMFSRVPNVSKLALISLAQILSDNGWHFIDCQFETPLFKSMGGRHISYEEYMKILKKKPKNNRQ